MKNQQPLANSEANLSESLQPVLHGQGQQRPKQTSTQVVQGDNSNVLTPQMLNSMQQSAFQPPPTPQTVQQTPCTFLQNQQQAVSERTAQTAPTLSAFPIPSQTQQNAQQASQEQQFIQQFQQAMHMVQQQNLPEQMQNQLQQFDGQNPQNVPAQLQNFQQLQQVGYQPILPQNSVQPNLLQYQQLLQQQNPQMQLTPQQMLQIQQLIAQQQNVPPQMPQIMHPHPNPYLGMIPMMPQPVQDNNAIANAIFQVGESRDDKKRKKDKV